MDSYDVLLARNLGGGSGGGGGSFTQVNADWSETDNTDPSYIENKPAIRAGEGENSIVEGDISVSSGSGIAKLSITGEANATEFSYTVVDNGGLNVSLVDCVCYIADASPATRKYQVIEELDAVNHKITFSASLSSSALTNSEVIVYRKYKKALGKNSHVEGTQTLAANHSSHAEGNNCAAVGNYSHAENNNTIAKSLGSHAEGSYTRAYSSYSHVEGLGTIAASEYQHVQGQYNIEDANGTYADIVGNGSSSTRSNAYTLDWNGNGVYAGKVTVGTAPTNDMDVATKKYVDDKKFIVTLSTQDGITYTTDKTFAEVKAVADANKDVVAKFAVPGNEYHTVVWLPMTFCNDSKITFSVYDVTANNSTPKGALYIGEILSNNTIQFHKYDFDVQA